MQEDLNSVDLEGLIGLQLQKPMLAWARGHAEAYPGVRSSVQGRPHRLLVHSALTLGGRIGSSPARVIVLVLIVLLLVFDHSHIDKVDLVEIGETDIIAP